jgi:hypothetical protein
MLIIIIIIITQKIKNENEKLNGKFGLVLNLFIRLKILENKKKRKKKKGMFGLDSVPLSFVFLNFINNS